MSIKQSSFIEKHRKFSKQELGDFSTTHPNISENNLMSEGSDVMREASQKQSGILTLGFVGETLQNIFLMLYELISCFTLDN